MNRQDKKIVGVLFNMAYLYVQSAKIDNVTRIKNLLFAIISQFQSD